MDKLIDFPEEALQKFFKNLVGFETADLTENEVSNTIIDLYEHMKSFSAPQQFDLRKSNRATREKLIEYQKLVDVGNFPILKEEKSEVWQLDYYVILLHEKRGKLGLLCYAHDDTIYPIFSMTLYRENKVYNPLFHTTTDGISNDFVYDLAMSICQIYFAKKLLQ